MSGIEPIQQDKICHQETCMIEARAREYALGVGKAGVCSKHGAKVDIEIMTCSYEKCKEIAMMNNICKLHNYERVKKRRKCSILGRSTPTDLIMVEGCGMADVNGVYQRDGKLAISYYDENQNKQYDKCLRVYQTSNLQWRIYYCYSQWRRSSVYTLSSRIVSMFKLLLIHQLTNIHFFFIVAGRYLFWIRSMISIVV